MKKKIKFSEGIYMAKLRVILFMLLLLGCEEEQECDAICEIHRANFENSTTGVVYSEKRYLKFFELDPLNIWQR